MIETYRGQRLEHMSKGELIEAVRLLGRQVRDYQSPDFGAARAQARVEAFRGPETKRGRAPWWWPVLLAALLLLLLLGIPQVQAQTIEPWGLSMDQAAAAAVERVLAAGCE